mgnify:CR=1 FL=1
MLNTMWSSRPSDRNLGFDILTEDKKAKKPQSKAKVQKSIKVSSFTL